MQVIVERLILPNGPATWEISIRISDTLHYRLAEVLQFYSLNLKNFDAEIANNLLALTKRYRDPSLKYHVTNAYELEDIHAG